MRIWVLHILTDKPKNGAEIMDSMEAMSQGWWRPSPGSVYPMLESMVEEEVIKKMADGRYQLTKKGREEADWPSRLRGVEPRSVEAVLETMSSYVSYLEDLSGSQKGKLEESAKRIRELSSRLAKIGGK